jgi:ribosomal protein S21
MKNKSSKLGILKAYRERQRYEKPSEIKVRKAKQGKINLYKAKLKRERNL